MKFSDNDIQDGILGGIMAAVVLTCYLLSCLGCTTTQCPPCIPEVETITINVPVDSCEPPEALPTLEYPPWPKVPQAASEDDWKAFYAIVVATVDARERIFLAHIAAQKELLDSYRK